MLDALAYWGNHIYSLLLLRSSCRTAEWCDRHGTKDDIDVAIPRNYCSSFVSCGVHNALIAPTRSGSGFTPSAVYISSNNGISRVLMIHFPELKISPFLCAHEVSEVVIVLLFSSTIHSGARYRSARMPYSQSSGVRIPLCYRFVDWAFSFSQLMPQLTQLFK